MTVLERVNLAPVRNELCISYTKKGTKTKQLSCFDNFVAETTQGW